LKDLSVLSVLSAVVTAAVTAEEEIVEIVHAETKFFPFPN
jgi:hypothetical protein